ncbi:PspC domain-containing protein [Sphingomonas sp. ID1715]|uniref:PspC domain-containing protein n=1 Tax=Sphingomonas sp. ID1715 TaxID=1656898 RepID=UPI0014884AE1|nr:PspC domain-containing protein [Sphingomonas sp. ID1715]NNM77593.1 PspC domain-containing protein [Sphingomonas sp. ID1715]
MQTANLLSRDDTFFGVCEALGTDLGFSPNILRIVFGVAVMWNPMLVIGTYAALGVLVFASRYFFPVARRQHPTIQAPKAAPKVEAVNDSVERELELAA